MNDRNMSGGSEQRLEALERRLRGALRPVAPPRDLVVRLRSRLHFPDRAEIASRLRDWEKLTLVLGGVLSGAVVLLTIARGLYHLFGRRGGA